jgi:hypothetical protein
MVWMYAGSFGVMGAHYLVKYRLRIGSAYARWRNRGEL